MNFYEWMMTQTERDDPVGDLAGDMKQDARSIEDRQRSISEWRRHVELRAGGAVVRALQQAISEYQEAISNKE